MAAPATNPQKNSKQPLSKTANANSNNTISSHNNIPAHDDTTSIHNSLNPLFDTLSESDRSFLNELRQEFPQFTFKPSSRFRFHPPKTIFLGQPQPYFALQTLHELGHGLSGLWDYNTHIERLSIESRAWQEAKRLCLNHPEWAKKYHLSWDEDAENFAENSLDTYRDWLHSKSKCPSCGLTRVATPDGKYHCPLCDLL